MTAGSGTEGTAFAAAQKATIGAEIITRTLDVVNQHETGSAAKNGDTAASYEFQKSVLSAAYSPKGVVADITS